MKGIDFLIGHALVGMYRRMHPEDCYVPEGDVEMDDEEGIDWENVDLSVLEPEGVGPRFSQRDLEVVIGDMMVEGVAFVISLVVIGLEGFLLLCCEEWCMRHWGWMEYVAWGLTFMGVVCLAWALYGFPESWSRYRRIRRELRGER